MLKTYRTDEVSEVPFERDIYAALHTEPNSIAGRPNACNFSLDYIQRGGAASRTITEHYYLHCLESFFPGVLFEVHALDEVDSQGWQVVQVIYQLT